MFSPSLIWVSTYRCTVNSFFSRLSLRWSIVGCFGRRRLSGEGDGRRRRAFCSTSLIARSSDIKRVTPTGEERRGGPEEGSRGTGAERGRRAGGRAATAVVVVHDDHQIVDGGSTATVSRRTDGRKREKRMGQRAKGGNDQKWEEREREGEREGTRRSAEGKGQTAQR